MSILEALRAAKYNLCELPFGEWVTKDVIEINAKIGRELLSKCVTLLNMGHSVHDEYYNPVDKNEPPNLLN